MTRPVGITVLGGLVCLAGLIMILIGIASFFVGLAFLMLTRRYRPHPMSLALSPIK